MSTSATPRSAAPATLSALAALAFLAFAAPAGAQSFEYAFALESGRSVAYDMEIEAVHPGPLRVEASWPGTRVVSFRLEPVGGGPGDGAVRSGRSPLVLEARVDRASEEAPSRWTLTIRGVPAREAAGGTLRVHLPYPAPEPVTVPVSAPAPVASGGPAAGTTPATPIPAGAPPAWRAFSARTDAFGAAIRGAAGPDSCRWQDDFHAFLESRRAALFSGAGDPDDESLRALGALRGMIDRVEELRTSSDPVLAGPPPDDPRRRLAWDRVRETRMNRMEEELDGLRRTLDRARAAWLAGEEWPLRLVGCLTACQRHFDERVLRGPGGAINYDLARAQWDRILDAGLALESLLELEPTDRAAN